MSKHEERAKRYAEAIDPEAFDETKKRSKHPAAEVQWAVRRKMATDAAEAALTVADAEQVELRAEVERLRIAEAREERVEIIQTLNAPTRCRVWRHGVLVFDGRSGSADAEQAKLRAEVERLAGELSTTDAVLRAEQEVRCDVEAERDRLAATIVQMRGKIASAVATWVDVVTLEPCETCAGSGVGLITADSDEAMESAIGGLLAILNSEADQ